MAKHANNTNMNLDSGTNQQVPYVYPNGRVYGAPAESGTQRTTTGTPYVSSSTQRTAYVPSSTAYAPASASATPYISRPKKRHTARNAFLVFLAILVLGAAALFFYIHSIDNRMSLDFSDISVVDTLVPEIGNEPFYMLLIGSDSRDPDASEDSSQRSDMMMLARIDKQNNTITLVSIPRDTPWQRENGEIVKLNEMYNIGGAAATVEAVSQLTGVSISHYAETHFLEFAELVDAVGGITYDVPMEMGYWDAITGDWIQLEPGVQDLNGQQTTILARIRKSYDGDQDANRQSTTRGIIEAIFHKVKEAPITSLPGIAYAASGCVSTDLSTVGLLMLAADLGTNVKFYEASGPHAGDIDPENGLWLCYSNPAGWQRLMAAVDAGEDPSGISYDQDEVYYPSTGEVVYFGE